MKQKIKNKRVKVLAILAAWRKKIREVNNGYGLVVLVPISVEINGSKKKKNNKKCKYSISYVVICRTSQKYQRIKNNQAPQTITPQI
jgi:hypothetical protein